MSHHPSDELIAAFAAGRLRPGAGLVVRAHLDVCKACRAEVLFFEALDGTMLESEIPSALASDALDRALASIERPPPPAPTTPPLAPPTGEAAVLPRGLGSLPLGRRRWVAPGVWMTPVRAGAPSSEKAYLLRISAGMALPRHTHRGCEFTAVLQGRFSDGAAQYGPGDFVSADEEVEHSPLVVGDETCICLISTDQRLVMRDLLSWFAARSAGI